MNILHEYWDILSDPAHTMVELTFTFVVDIIVLGLLWPLIAKRIRREHVLIDTEHKAGHHQLAEVHDLLAYRHHHPKTTPDGGSVS